MKVVQASHEVLFKEDRDVIYKMIERIGRVCYRSEDKITEDSAKKFVEMIMRRRHYAMIEHVHVSVKWTVDRGLANAMTRHRIAAFAQESTMYCNYAGARFGGEIAVICPQNNMAPAAMSYWEGSCRVAEQAYMAMLANGTPPVVARSVLPLCTKTELVSTFDLREWRHFFSMRADPADSVQMQRVASAALLEFQVWMPEIFESVRPYSTLSGEGE